MKKVLQIGGLLLAAIGGVIFQLDQVFGVIDVQNITNLSEPHWKALITIVPLGIGSIAFAIGTFMGIFQKPLGRIARARMSGRKFFLMTLTVLFLTSCAGPQKGFNYSAHAKKNKTYAKKAGKKMKAGGGSLVKYKCRQK